MYLDIEEIEILWKSYSKKPTSFQLKVDSTKEVSHYLCSIFHQKAVFNESQINLLLVGQQKAIELGSVASECFQIS